MSSPAEPLVIVKLGKEKIKVLVDTGATYSVLNTLGGELSQDTVEVIGVAGVSETKGLSFSL